jgi:chromate transporter
MKLLFLYALLLKATLTTFSGLASLPVVRNDLVLHYGWITDRQLDTAVVVTRTTPGPVGVYVVSVGYFAAGVPGAIAGWLAMITPALLIIPLLRFASSRAQHPRVKGMINTVVLASAGLLWASAVPLTREIAPDPFTWGLLAVCTAVLLTRKVESLWVVISAGLVELAASSLHIIHAPLN